MSDETIADAKEPLQIKLQIKWYTGSYLGIDDSERPLSVLYAAEQNQDQHNDHDEA